MVRRYDGAGRRRTEEHAHLQSVPIVTKEIVHSSAYCHQWGTTRASMTNTEGSNRVVISEDGTGWRDGYVSASVRLDRGRVIK